MSIVGRNEASDWVYMVSEDNKTGWVAASLLTIDGDISKLSIRSIEEALNPAPAIKVSPTHRAHPTATRKAVILPTNTPRPANPFTVPLCSDLACKVGQRVSCKIPRAYCDYRPDVNGSPTFCDDHAYTNQDFQLVVFGADWSEFHGSCIMVSGIMGTYRGVLQIKATSRSQVSYCQ